MYTQHKGVVNLFLNKCSLEKDIELKRTRRRTFYVGNVGGTNGTPMVGRYK